MMKKVLKVIKTVLLCILAVIVIAAGYLFISPLLIRHNDSATEGSRTWMSKLSDDALINEISIPGTHDSASMNVVLPYFAKCQASNIRTQLDDGFRYLDIRLGAKRVQNEDRLLLYHGFCNCKESWTPWSKNLDLSSVLAQCYSFLSDYPSETIIFVVKMEQGSDLKSFQMLLDSYISKGQEKWLLTDTLPALGECRGKIVLIRRYQDVCGLGKRAGIHMEWVDQGENDDVTPSTEVVKQDNFTLLVQDRFKYGVEDKWNAFIAGLTAGSADETAVRISFLSTNGTPKFGHPHSYAKTLNAKFLETDLSQYPRQWMIIDFTDAKLAEHIYLLNK